MEKELNDLLEKQAQLEAMQKSLMAFGQKLKDQQDEFLIKHLGFKKEDKNVSIFEMIRRATKSKIIT